MDAPTTFDVTDFKPDMKTLGFEDNEAELSAPAPPPYNIPANGNQLAAPAPQRARKMSVRTAALREWMGNHVMRAGAGSTGPITPPESPELLQTLHTDIILASEFRHNGDAVIVVNDVGFQVDSRVLCAASASLETLVGRQKLSSSDGQNIILALNAHSEEDTRCLLSIITPYAFYSPRSLSLEALTTVADLFDTFAMRPAARFGLARVVEARSSTLDPTCVHQCVAWARLAHKVRSVPTLKKALGVSAPSVLREYWLLPDSTATALQPHLYRALVLAGNTYSLLGEEGLNTIQFKYQEGQLCLTNSDGDVVGN